MCLFPSFNFMNILHCDIQFSTPFLFENATLYFSTHPHTYMLLHNSERPQKYYTAHFVKHDTALCSKIVFISFLGLR